MGGTGCKREKKATAVFATVAVAAAAGAAANALKIAATPLDPLGLPKLPLRVAKLGVCTAVAASAALVTAARIRRRSINDGIRESLRPNKAARGCEP